MIQDSESPMKELIVLNETNHGHQCDVLVLIPLEAFLMTMDSFQLNYVELYLLNTKCVLHFLSRAGFANAYETQAVEEEIAPLRERYLDYVLKEPTEETPADIEKTPHEESPAGEE